MVRVALLCGVGRAWAAPSFHFEDEKDRHYVESAWRHAEACAGRPTAVRRVDVVHGEAGMRFGGFVRHAADGTATMVMSPTARPIIYAHEVGHLWFHGSGSDAIDEGRAEVFAACVAAADPDVFRTLYSDVGNLAKLPDLRTWGYSRVAPDPEVTLAGYAGALRFFRAAAAVTSRETVFSAAWDTWDGVRAGLAQSAWGRELLAGLDGGPEALRPLLEDVDHDALGAVEERVLGTDPGRWDTDGDGWWDGAPTTRPDHATPIPHDAATCLARIPADREEFAVVAGGAFRGSEVAPVFTASASASSTAALTPLLRELGGGMWVAVEGDGRGLVANTRCVAAPGYIVHLESDQDLDLRPFGAALARAWAAVEGRGLSPRQLDVEVSREAEHVEGRANSVGVPLAWATRREGTALDRVAREVVVVGLTTRARLTTGDQSAAHLLAGWLWPDTKGVGSLLVTREGTAAAEARLAACARGWVGLLDGSCRP